MASNSTLQEQLTLFICALGPKSLVVYVVSPKTKRQFSIKETDLSVHNL